MHLIIYKTIDLENEFDVSELEDKWVRVDDVRKLIEDKIEYLKSNELYPSYGLNSQVEALIQLMDWFK